MTLTLMALIRSAITPFPIRPTRPMPTTGTTTENGDLDCPVCGASFIEDPHEKLHAATCMKLEGKNPVQFQCRCKGCETRGPRMADRKEAKTEWAKIRQRS